MSALTVFSVIVAVATPSLSFPYDDDDFTNRIMGGDIPDIMYSPYVGALLWRKQHKCGATLISYSIAVTAAHCLDRDIRELRLRVGSIEWNRGGQVISIKYIIKHENYKEGIFDYDVGILILYETVKVRNASPIPMAAAYRKYPEGTVGVVYGWGTTHTVRTSDILLKVKLPIVHERSCRRKYIVPITYRQICAGHKLDGRSSCTGDSGGPLVINGELAGIVSFGAEICDMPLIPSVFTSVPAFNAWIRYYAGVKWHEIFGII